MNEREERRKLRRERRAAFAALTPGEKWQFFQDYYLKGTVICLILLLILIGAGRDIWRGKRPCLFYALVINQYSDIPDSLREGFVDYAGLDTRKYNVIIDTTMRIDLARMDDMTRNYLQEVIAIASTGKQDVFLADEQVISYYWETEYITDIRECLSEECWREFEDRFYYLENEQGEPVPVGILVGDSPRLQELGMYPYQQPVLSAVYHAPNPTQVESFLHYLYDQN